jgi:hypothetical protein
MYYESPLLYAIYVSDIEHTTNDDNQYDANLTGMYDEY